MSRKNNKEQITSTQNGIKKSNKLSMAKMNEGLSLNQMQLLAYAIFSTQQDGNTEFHKHDLEKKFNIDYKTKHAKEDAQKVSIVQFSVEDLENDYFEFWNVFKAIKYKNGKFTFKWNEEFIPHILEIKEKYVLTDLAITSNFKSNFSWTLYEYLKAHYGNWFKELSKEALMRLFSVENRITYRKSTAQLKRTVLDTAISEINEYTELDVWYTEKKVGNKIVGFVLHWSTGKTIPGATKKQITLLNKIYAEIDANMFEYLAVKDIETARNHIIQAKDIHLKVKKGISINAADDYIKELLEIYKKLENIVEMDGKKRDTSIYYNWLEEIEE